MVDHSVRLNLIFGALSDPTRRDILRRGAKEELSISTMAEAYDMTLAAISKHVIVLEKAKLVKKRRIGRQHFIRLSPEAFSDASGYLKRYEKIWNDRLDSLEQYLLSYKESPKS